MLEEQVDLRFVSYIIQSEKAASLILITTKVTCLFHFSACVQE